MDISQNDVSNKALWIFYGRLLEQARQLEISLAASPYRVNNATPTGIPPRPNPITPIRRPHGHDSSDPQDDGTSKDAEGDVNAENDQSSSHLGQDQRQVTITLSSPLVRSDGSGPAQDPSRPSNSSNRPRTPPELRVPVQPLRAYPSELRNVPDLEITRPELIEPAGSRQARRRVTVTRETVEAYRQLVDNYMGVRYNIYTDDTPSPDSSQSSTSELGPIDESVLSLITVNAYIDVSVIESTAYDISDLGLASEGNCYIGGFDFEGPMKLTRSKFRERTWADLVSKSDALGNDYDTAYPKVCDYLRSKRKLVMFVNVGRHATVLTLVRDSKIATFFDTLTNLNTDLRATMLCSSVIRSVFKETTEGWVLQIPPMGQQVKRANNCGMHALLRIKDELEDNKRHNTNETSANTLRLYLSLRGAYGEQRYPLDNILYEDVPQS